MAYLRYVFSGAVYQWKSKMIDSSVLCAIPLSFDKPCPIIESTFSYKDCLVRKLGCVKQETR